MTITIETTTTNPVYQLFEKLGKGEIIAYDGCPVEECGQYECENFSSVTVLI